MIGSGDSPFAARCSFVHHRLQQAGAQFADIGGGITAAVSLGGTDEKVAERMGLVDLSPLPRIGYKGAGAPAWLRRQGVVLPPQPNCAGGQTDGTLVVALSAEEHLLLSPLSGGGECCQRLAAAWSLDEVERCWQLPRADSHCWFVVCGDCAEDMLAKLCGVDLRRQSFAVHAVAQTSLARLNAVIIRRRAAPVAVFDLLADSASAEYLWDCLLDAMTEFEGRVVGLNALRVLLG